MIRISRKEIIERWAITYSEDGYYVRADRIEGLPHPMPVNQVVPAIEATKEGGRVLVWVIESQATLEDPHTQLELQALNAARNDATALHVVVAAECATGLKEKMDGWGIHPDTVHVT
jgi:hypothetical protein